MKMDEWDITIYFEDFTMLFGLIFRISMLTFLIVKFIKKDKTICNIYFYFIFVGYFWNTLFTFFYNAFNFCYYTTSEEEYWDKCYIFTMGSNVSEWYHTQFCAVWTLLLTINRFTAIVWWQKYDKFWSKWFKYFLAFLLLYPFLINGNTFFIFNCRFQIDTTNCTEIWNIENKIGAISGATITILSLIVSIITVYFYRKTLKNTKTATQKREHKLMFQAILSSMSFIFYFIISGYDNFLFVNEEQIFSIYLIKTIAKIIFLILEYFLLLIFSAYVRRQYIAFCHLTWIYKLTTKNGQQQIIVIPQAPTSTTRSFTQIK